MMEKIFIPITCDILFHILAKEYGEGLKQEGLFSSKQRKIIKGGYEMIGYVSKYMF
jgi:hypothetical protein